MGQYTNKGLYNSYDKNHKERDSLDYYATPTEETKNILDVLNIDFNDKIILEPSCGGGHMCQGIQAYLRKNGQSATLLATDIHSHEKIYDFDCSVGEEYDFIADDYPIDEADWIIMNPPYSTIEPFTIRALDIAKEGIIMLGRLQFLESSARYDNIFKDNPPTDIYVYVERIQCWKGGVKPSGSSAQAYAWFVWDKKRIGEEPNMHWLHRKD